MTRRLRSTITLVVMVVVMVVGGAWAWAALTNPFPDGGLFGDGPEEDVEVCTTRTVESGTRITKREVTVSVFNAGSETGAASQTMERLVDNGFAEGVDGNAPDDAEVDRVQIWTDDRRNPAVRLVATWLGDDIRIAERETDVPGVYIVVGDEFDELADGRNRIRVQREAEICGPANAA